MLDIDGSHGEGGGQILRSCLSLSLLTGKAFRLSQIRAGRSKPGLQPQHLMSVRAAARIGDARLRGDSIGSRELTFEPNAVASGSYRFAIGTAGATGLVLHTLYLPLALRGNGPSHLTLEGGTHVTHAPTFQFLDGTWAAYMTRLGLQISLKLIRPGFYPRGGGIIEVAIQPCSQLTGITLTQRDSIEQVTGFSAVAGLPESIAKRQARRAMFRLAQAKLVARIDHESWPDGPGTVLGIRVDSPMPTWFTALGERGKPADKVADDAVDQVIAHVASNAPVDRFSADQMLLPLAFAGGPSEFHVAEITQHLLTNIATIKHFLERDFIVTGEVGSPGHVIIGPAARV
jgi:RNA 3'-terminal phosphate cyclase (ATP)